MRTVGYNFTALKNVRTLRMCKIVSRVQALLLSDVLCSVIA